MKYLIAFSGGLDSTVLLYQFLQRGETMRAIHVHHGLSPHADQWAVHCKNICAAWDVPLKIVRAKIKRQPKESLEALAREARYKIFAEHLAEGETLVTAHHQNDQAETFLLHAFRGAGPQGLAAMPELKKFTRGWHWRPLLHETRKSLEVFAKQHELTWIHDESNENISFDRNFIRHKIIPLLETRWPALVPNLSRAAETQAELSDFLDAQLEPLWKKLPQAIEALDVHPIAKQNAICLPLHLIHSLPLPLQNCSLREWVKKNTGMILAKHQLHRIHKEVISAKIDKQPQLKIGKYNLHRYTNALWLVDKNKKCADNNKLLGCISQRLNIPIEDLSLGYRKGGERFRLKKNAHTTSLKKLLHAQKIPPWLRAHLPLVCDNTGTLISIGGCEL